MYLLPSWPPGHSSHAYTPPGHSSHPLFTIHTSWSLISPHTYTPPGHSSHPPSSPSLHVTHSLPPLPPYRSLSVACQTGYGSTTTTRTMSLGPASSGSSSMQGGWAGREGGVAGSSDHPSRAGRRLVGVAWPWLVGQAGRLAGHIMAHHSTAHTPHHSTSWHIRHITAHDILSNRITAQHSTAHHGTTHRITSHHITSWLAVPGMWIIDK